MHCTWNVQHRKYCDSLMMMFLIGAASVALCVPVLPLLNFDRNDCNFRFFLRHNVSLMPNSKRFGFLLFIPFFVFNAIWRVLFRMFSKDFYIKKKSVCKMCVCVYSCDCIVTNSLSRKMMIDLLDFPSFVGNQMALQCG